MNVRREARFIAYSSGNFGKNLLWSTADITLLYVLTDFLGLAPGMAGAIFFAGLVCDAVFDLLVGVLAQRSRAPVGQYAPFILLGMPACAAAFLLLYSLPLIGGASVATIAAAMLLFRGFYAFVDIPHNALIAKLPASSRQRNRITGYRFFFSSAASLLIATALPAITAIGGVGPLFDFAGLAALAALATLWMAWWAVRRADRLPQASLSRASTPRASLLLGELFRDRTFRQLLLIVAITGLAPPLFARSLIYYASYVLGDRAASSSALMGVAIGQFIGILVWSWIASSREKGTALAIGHGLTALALVAIWAFEPHGIAIAALGGLAGMGLASIYMVIWSMAPDVVDLLEAQSGRRPDALLFAILILAMKAATGLSATAFGVALDSVGYDPGGLQNPDVRLTIAAFTCLIPAAGCIACALLARRWPLTYKIQSSDSRNRPHPCGLAD